MDSGNGNAGNPYRHLPRPQLSPQIQTALPLNTNVDRDIFGAMHVPPMVYQPPLPLAARQLHDMYAGLCVGSLNQAMQEFIRIQMHYFWDHHTSQLINIAALKQQLLPMARIKRAMKANPAVKMISADTPVLFSKACELFIMELTFRAWLYAEVGDKKTLERTDMMNVIEQSNMFSFLSKD